MGDAGICKIKAFPNGIEVYRGCTGDIRLVTEGFLEGQIFGSGEGCQHDRHTGAEHQCNN